MEFRKNIRGRGASSNTPNRFSATDYVPEIQEWDAFEEKVLLRTEVLKDTSRTIINENNSPDISFRYSVNAYRGCEHGCAYCYARPTHEYLGYSAGLEFETKIFVKENAAQLLREKLASRGWKPDTVIMSGVTDCYQPLEREWRLTRQCLEVFLDFRNPVSLITKNFLITHDLDLFHELARMNLTMIFISVTTLDEKLGGALEPRASRPQARLKAIELLAKAGVPVGVNVAPVIPGLTDHEMPNILHAAAGAGAVLAGYTPLRLPLAVEPLFVEWLGAHRPEKKEKVLSQIRSLRQGKLNDGNFGTRMRGSGAFAENLRQMFAIYCRKEGLNQSEIQLTTELFRRPTTQMEFDF